MSNINHSNELQSNCPFMFIALLSINFSLGATNGAFSFQVRQRRNSHNLLGPSASAATFSTSCMEHTHMRIWFSALFHDTRG